MAVTRLSPRVQAEKISPKYDIKTLIAPLDFLLRDSSLHRTKPEELLETIEQKGVKFVMVSTGGENPEIHIPELRAPMSRAISIAILKDREFPQIKIGPARMALISTVISMEIASAGYDNSHNIAFVSDLPTDIKAAKPTRCLLVGVSSNNSERDQLVMAGADQVSKSLINFCNNGIRKANYEAEPATWKRSRFA